MRHDWQLFRPGIEIVDFSIRAVFYFSWKIYWRRITTERNISSWCVLYRACEKCHYKLSTEWIPVVTFQTKTPLSVFHVMVDNSNILLSLLFITICIALYFQHAQVRQKCIKQNIVKYVTLKSMSSLLWSVTCRCWNIREDVG